MGLFQKFIPQKAGQNVSGTEILATIDSFLIYLFVRLAEIPQNKSMVEAI
jgi:hypothetical protein